MRIPHDLFHRRNPVHVFQHNHRTMALARTVRPSPLTDETARGPRVRRGWRRALHRLRIIGQKTLPMPQPPHVRDQRRSQRRAVSVNLRHLFGISTPNGFHPTRQWFSMSIHCPNASPSPIPAPVISSPTSCTPDIPYARHPVRPISRTPDIPYPHPDPLHFLFPHFLFPFPPFLAQDPHSPLREQDQERHHQGKQSNRFR